MYAQAIKLNSYDEDDMPVTTDPVEDDMPVTTDPVEDDMPVTTDPVEDDMPVTTDPVVDDEMPADEDPEYENIWAWLELNADGIYSEASEAVRHAQYVSLADDISRFIAEEAPDYLIGPLVDTAADDVTDEWREGARLDILGRFEAFDLDELFSDIGPIQLEHAETFLCNEYGDCREEVDEIFEN